MPFILVDCNLSENLASFGGIHRELEMLEYELFYGLGNCTLHTKILQLLQFAP